MSTNKITGMSASVIKNGKMVWAKAYGLADRKTSKPMTLNTLFALASVSKTITADAFMIEWEKGSFQLDQPINNYLPWTVANPNHTSTSITVRHLMTHLSSIDDNWDVIDANMVKGDSPIQMSTFLHDYLVPGSSNYYATKNFFTYAPGTQFNYSNMATTICGYITEHLSGIKFSKYCEDSIFTPLCMDDTHWFISEIPDTNMLARPYVYSSSSYKDQGLLGLPVYPVVQLRTSVISLSKFLLMNMQYGRFDGKRILDSATVKMMRTSQYPAIADGQGLIWYGYALPDNRIVWGHSGEFSGYRTEMWMDEAKKEGVIVLTNSDVSDLDPVVAKLFTYADTASIVGKPNLTCNYSVNTPEINAETNFVNVFPNPFQTKTTLQSSISLNNADLFIYNIFGQKVRSLGGIYGKELTIERDNLNNGVYIYELIQSGLKIKDGKLIICD